MEESGRCGGSKSRHKDSYTGIRGNRQSESYDTGWAWAGVSGGRHTRLGSGLKTHRYNFQLWYRSEISCVTKAGTLHLSCWLLQTVSGTRWIFTESVFCGVTRLLTLDFPFVCTLSLDPFSVFLPPLPCLSHPCLCQDSCSRLLRSSVPLVLPLVWSVLHTEARGISLKGKSDHIAPYF